MRLKLERFGLPNKPSGTPAHRRWVGAESENKPTGTPEYPEGIIRCAARGERSSPRPPEAAKRLEVERFEEKSTVWLDGGRERG